jgi:DnaJ like chaperone protein
MANASSKTGGGFSAVLRDMKISLGELFTGGRLDSNQELLVQVLYGLLGYLAAADSIVTSHEAEFTNDLMDELHLPTRGREVAMAAFDRGRKRQIDLDLELQRFLVTFPKGSPEVARLYDSLVRLAGADGRIRPGERAFLEKITLGLGFSPEVLASRLI